MYKYNVNIMPSSFDNVFSKLHYMHDHGTRQVSENFHHKRVWTYYGKKMLRYVGPVAWGRICSNSITLPLHMFSCRVKLRLLAGYSLLCEIFLWFVRCLWALLTLLSACLGRLSPNLYSLFEFNVNGNAFYCCVLAGKHDLTWL